MLRTATADFFIGVPEKNQPLARTQFRRSQRINRGERQHEPGLHIEGSRPVSAPSLNAKRHFRQCPQRIHGIEMSQNQDLALRPPVSEPQFRTHMISAPCLPQDADLRAATPPFACDHSPESVYGSFIVARRLAANELLEQSRDLFLVASRFALQAVHYGTALVHRARILSAASCDGNAACPIIPTRPGFV